MQFNKSMFVLQGERKSPLKFMSKSVFDTKRIVCITWNRRNQFSCYLGTCHHANCHDWPWKWERWKKLNQTKFLESPFRYWKSINIYIKGHYWQIKTYPHRQKISYDLQIWNKKAEMHPNACYGSYNGIEEWIHHENSSECCPKRYWYNWENTIQVWNHQTSIETIWACWYDTCEDRKLQQWLTGWEQLLWRHRADKECYVMRWVVLGWIQIWMDTIWKYRKWIYSSKEKFLDDAYVLFGWNFNQFPWIQ